MILGDGTECIPLSYYCDGSVDNGNSSWGPDCSNGADEVLDDCCEAELYSADTCGDDGGGDGPEEFAKKDIVLKVHTGMATAAMIVIIV